MKEVLSGYVKRLSASLAVCTAVIGGVLLMQGEGRLIGALLAGYLAAGVCMWTIAYRTWSSAGLDAASAPKQMLRGLMLRLTTIFVVLGAAARISVRVFAVTALGLLLGYGLALVHLIAANIRSDKK